MSPATSLTTVSSKYVSSCDMITVAVVIVVYSIISNKLDSCECLVYLQLCHYHHNIITVTVVIVVCSIINNKL